MITVHPRATQLHTISQLCYCDVYPSDAWVPRSAFVDSHTFSKLRSLSSHRLATSPIYDSKAPETSAICRIRRVEALIRWNDVFNVRCSTAGDQVQMMCQRWNKRHSAAIWLVGWRYECLEYIVMRFSFGVEVR